MATLATFTGVNLGVLVEQGNTLSAAAATAGIDNDAAPTFTLADTGGSTPYVEAWQRAQDLVVQEGKQRIRLKRVDVVERSLDVSNEALQQLYAALLRGEIEPKDLIGIVKGGMVGHGIGSDKLAVSEGEPTHIVQKTSNITETLSKLTRFEVV
jgi:hypothetical protein